ncbi:MAG TPA: hypothetical protein VJP02_04580 [Candidatus Sulfotelmatobacter sp.]|nr:hypothetical protein [Candidatus Sulfotelmatobacter sp.]
MSSIAELEQQLKDAKATAAKEQREKDIARLRQIRSTLRTALRTYEVGRAKVKRAQGAIDALKSRIANLQEMLFEHNRRAPECAALAELADDPDVMRWRTEGEEIEARIANLKAEIVDVQKSMPESNELAAYEGDDGLIARMRWSERNLVMKLKGATLGKFEGGVARWGV